MDIRQFTDAIITLRLEFNFSITSWARTEKRNKEVGGVEKSFHLCGLGLDIVLDSPVVKDLLIARAKRLGLQAIDEGDHIHLEPA